MINKNVLSKKKLNTKIESMLNPIKNELVTRARSMMDYVTHHEDDLKQAIDKAIEAKAHRMDKQWDDNNTLTVMCHLSMSYEPLPQITQYEDENEFDLNLRLPMNYTAGIDDSKLPNDKTKFKMSADQYLNNFVTVGAFIYDYKKNTLSCMLAKDVYMQKVSKDVSKLWEQYLYSQGIKAVIKNNTDNRIVVQIDRNDFEIEDDGGS